jgi:4-azaleucine resistance transporter AzlC
VTRGAVDDGFLGGFRALVPLWLGVIPFALVFAVTARDAGLSAVETQALSALVFAGSAQFSAAGMFGAGAGGLAIVLTTFLLNIRHLLYGLALTRQITLRDREVVPAAFFLTDEAFGVTAAARARTSSFLFGAEISLYLVWNLATLAGSVTAAAVPDPERLGVDLVFPLSFLALLVPLLRGRVELVVAAVAGGLAWTLSRWLPGGLPILVAGVAGSLLGAWLTRGRALDDATDLADAVREVA